MSSEQEFQQELRIQSTKLLGLRLFRVPSGKIRTDKGTWVECFPVGASDLMGILYPEGIVIFVECKGQRTPTTPEQLAWIEWVRKMGGIALLVRGPDVSKAIDEIVLAIAARRA